MDNKIKMRRTFIINRGVKLKKAIKIYIYNVRLIKENFAARSFHLA